MHHLCRAVRLHADHHAIGAHEIIDLRAFAQKLGVGGHIEVELRIGLADGLFDEFVCLHWHGGFGHHHHVILGRLGNFGGRCHHVGEIRMPVAAPRRRAHGDEDRIGPLDGDRGIKGEGEPSGFHILGYERIKAGLIDWHLATFQHLDLFRILVGADHIMAEIRKTNAREQAHIACSDQRFA